METQIIYDAIREITSHIAKINDELGQLQVDVAVLKTQVSELMWWFRGTAAGLIILIVGRLWKLIISFRNKRNEG